ncbi:MAG: hypothetical protein AAF225_01485 [Pseudomonadota bacterium]
MIIDPLVPHAEFSSTEPQSAATVDPRRQAAEQLQVAFFKDMLMYGGFAEAFETGSNTLDSFTSMVLENVAHEIAMKDRSLAEHFYRQLQDQNKDPAT